MDVRVNGVDGSEIHCTFTILFSVRVAHRGFKTGWEWPELGWLLDYMLPVTLVIVASL